MGFHVHYKNDDPSDNRFANLKLISRSDHVSMHKATGKTVVKLKCPVCKKVFVKERSQTRLARKKQKTTCCSRSCLAIISNRK